MAAKTKTGQNMISNGVLSVDKKEIKYKLIRSQRNTIGISIDPENGVIIRAPKRISQKTLLDLIQSKSGWILEKSIQIQDQKNLKPVRRYEDGEEFLYMGKKYRLKITEDNTIRKPVIVLREDEINVILPEDKIGFTDRSEIIHKLLLVWYKEQARIYITERVHHFVSICGEEPAKVIIKEQKRRWGSCAQNRTLRFNWRCIMAPEKVLDYVVVHEMCHLRYMNHGEKFWEMTGTVLPDYAERKRWLKQYGIMLEV